MMIKWAYEINNKVKIILLVINKSIGIVTIVINVDGNINVIIAL